jgi:polar amino acid transport system substrate-binding protein
MAAIAAGTQDVATGALTGDSRAQGARFSAPYRAEQIALFVPRGMASSYAANTGAELLARVREGTFRLGVSAGYSYGREVDEAISDLSALGRILSTESEYELFRALQEKQIDGFVADRLVGTTIGWRTGLLGLTDEHPAWLARNEVRLMIGGHVAPEIVTALDRGVRQTQASGEYSRIVRSYVMPLLLAETVGRPWFNTLNFIATCVLAVSGVILAYTGGFSIFGAFVLAALPSVGGGILRDLLVGRRPIAVMREPDMLLYVALTVAAGWMVIRAWPRGRSKSEHTAGVVPPWFEWTVEICDAIGLGALTVIGVLVAMETRSEPLLLWGPTLAVITTVGGGVMRDLVRGAGGLATLKGSLYAEIAIGWSAALSLFFYWQATRVEPREIVLATICCAAGAAITRVAAVAMGVTGPMLAPRAPA